MRNSLFLKQVSHYLLAAAVLLLPWQTQWIVTRALLGGEATSYGVLSLYIVEAFIAFAFVLRGRRVASEAVQLTWKAAYVFVAMAFFSLSFASVVEVGWFHVIHLLSALMLYLLLTDEQTDVRLMMRLFLFGMIVPMVIGWAQVFTGSSAASTVLGMGAKDAQTAGVAVVESFDVRTLRAYGTFPHPNIFGGYVAVGIIVLAWMARLVEGKKQLIELLLFAALLGATLIMTFSRSAWLGLFIALFGLVAFLLWQRKLPPRRAIPIMVLGLASILSALVVFHSQVITRFTPSQRLEAISIEERASQYGGFDEVFLSAPVLGVGPAAYPYVLEAQAPGHPGWAYQPIHNAFLLILAELGVVGALGLLFWVYRMDSITHGNKMRVGGLFGMAMGTVLLVIGLFDHYLWSFWPGLALAAFGLGLMVRWGEAR